MTDAVIVQASPESAIGFQCYGGAREFWRYRGHEVIMHGPYETGKTIAALNKLHLLLCKYAGAHALMVRNTYKSLIASAVVTYEKKVLPVSPDHPQSPIKKYGGERPDFYIYPNMSRLALGGMDNPDKFLSAEFDFIYINQAEEINLDDWEKLVGRATGRAGHTPYAQVMGDCNPAYPWHWILTRKQIKLFQQMHEHNPTLFNQETGEITPQGKITMQVLDGLTGIRYLRGRKGLWVAAEGVIYDTFSLDHNVTTTADYTPDREVFWGLDDGYAHGDGVGTQGHHPRVILQAQQMADGSVHIFDEYYHTLQLPEQSIAECLTRPYARPTLALVDSSAAELRRRLADAGIINAGNTHPVADGIKVVRRFVLDGNGVRLLKIHPRCTNLIRELQMYRYDDRSSVAQAGEPKPLKMDDHAPDALRYLLWQFR